MYVDIYIYMPIWVMDELILVGPAHLVGCWGQLFAGTRGNFYYFYTGCLLDIWGVPKGVPPNPWQIGICPYKPSILDLWKPPYKIQIICGNQKDKDNDDGPIHLATHQSPELGLGGIGNGDPTASHGSFCGNLQNPGFQIIFYRLAVSYEFIIVYP